MTTRILAVRGRTEHARKRGQSPFSTRKNHQEKGDCPLFRSPPSQTAAARRDFHHGLLAPGRLIAPDPEPPGLQADLCHVGDAIVLTG